MEFRQLEAFVNAVKYKSFSKAADATFLTQPTISAHINNLENEMGTTLVNRTGREITLTKQGELFYPYAIDMLHTRSQALATVQAQCETMDGVLDLYASSDSGAVLSAPAHRGVSCQNALKSVFMWISRTVRL